MDQVDVDLPPEVRARLAHKGKLLFEKFCGTNARGICAESFALYHIWRGEGQVARDFLTYLDTTIGSLRTSDPDGRLAMAEDLAGRIRGHLEKEGDEPPPPSLWASILKDRKRSISTEIVMHR
jgi:hypothetical protein